MVLDIYAKKSDGSGAREDEPSWRILQEPRSLLVTTGSLYRDYLHGIAEVEVDTDLTEDVVANWNLLGSKDVFEGGVKKRETRISLTFRDVLTVRQLGKGFKFLGKRP
jgi:alkylated DNA repair protein alkB family protein 6